MRDFSEQVTIRKVILKLNKAITLPNWVGEETKYLNGFL